MADLEKDLRYIKRNELIDIIYEYQQNDKLLREENAELKNVLSDRRSRLEKVGSIAEAAVAISGVFEAAQSAAEQYLSEVRLLNDGAEDKAKKIIAAAKTEAQALKMNTQKECLEMLRKAEEECALKKEKIMQLIDSYEVLRTLLNRQ